MAQLSSSIRAAALIAAAGVIPAVACGQGVQNGANGAGGRLLDDGGLEILADGAIVSTSSGGGGGSGGGTGSGSGGTILSGSDSGGPSGACTGANPTGCSCAPVGSTTSCWTGPPADRGLGDCKDGVSTCAESDEGTRDAWGPCIGEVLDCGDVAAPPPPPPPPPADAAPPPLPPQSCVAGSSLSILIVGSKVTAYVPNGSWSSGATGVVVVPIEGASIPAPITIPTAQQLNSCSSDSSLNKVVCVGNNVDATGDDVYVISGVTNAITSTLTSAAKTSESFSGGSCDTCAQAIDPVHHTDYISIGVTSGTSTSAAFQPLDLSTGTLSTPIVANAQLATSENILIDPARGLLLSPNENLSDDGTGSGDFQLMNTATGKVYDFINPGGTSTGEFDSAGEDCETGIAIATVEGSASLFLTDLTQAKFTGTTWAAPYTFQSVPDFSTFSAGTCGVAVAPSSHLGVVTDEFGTAAFGAIELPAKSGSGAPTLVDWVAATVPDDPSGQAFDDGFDPHTVTAYTSPATGKAYAVMVDYSETTGAPSYVVVVDLAALLALPRATAGAHTLKTPLAVGAVARYIAL